MGIVPEQHRPVIRAELDALVRGQRPSMLLWVQEYPATLVQQPEAIWSHPRCEAGSRADGTAWCVLPLWTSDEAPSDLSAEIELDREGKAVIHDVRVL